MWGFTAVRAAGAPDLQLSRGVDSLLRVLDGVIANRDLYLAAKEKRVEGLKKERGLLRSDREVFSKNEEIINEYESFVCDSAKAYLRENLAIAGRLRDSVLVGQSAIRLALIYSMCI